MKNTKKLLALLLAMVMCVSLFAACGNEPAPVSSDAPVESSDAPSQEPTGGDDAILNIGTSYFDGKFSPFFYTNDYENQVLTLVYTGAYGLDREGAPVYNSWSGETRAYNGTDYVYDGGLCDVTVTENDDGTVTFDYVMREDVVFSDGEPVTIDDLIFSMYVMLDPTYDGIATLNSLPIEGLAEYQGSMSTMSAAIAGAGRDNADFSKWTEEQQNAFWAAVDEGGAAFAQEIVDYFGEGVSVADAAAQWAFEGLAADATTVDFFMAIGDAYGWSFASMEAESAGSALADLIPEDVYSMSTVGVAVGEDVPNVSGIVKTGDYSATVKLTEVSTAAPYQLGVTICPMHYYGDPDLYDYDNNMFGFPKGDLSIVRAKTSAPVGCGPYTFVSWENNAVTLEANSQYFQGEPKIKYIVFHSMDDQDLIPALQTGTIDLCSPSFSKQVVSQISEINGGAGVTGDVITTETVMNLGYGYVGFAAKNVTVGDDSTGSSDASKALRKAIATVIAVYRDLAVDSYYGSELATVINYPISDTSWAAPRVTDEGYRAAFSVDADGNDIYTDGMTADEKYAAAKAAALTFFEAAGYTVEDGKITAAPAGAPMDVEVTVVGAGSGDHPTFLALSEASKALGEIGFNFIVTDISDFSLLTNAVNAGEAEMFAMAWQATPDPDMYQIYHSMGGSNEKSYWVKDAELDELIMAARQSMDQTYRRAIYKECLDIIADWAVEIPMYQRMNAFCLSTERVNISTLTPDITTYWDWENDIQLLEMN